MLNVEVLSRIQFALSITFHIIFPTLNLGLALFLVVVEGLYLKTKQTRYLRITQYWTKLFALTFGMGVVSGLVMSYQIGTNFGPFSSKVGQVIGPLFTYEVLSAFFLEAGFLGIMLFGWQRVSARSHYLATCLVWLGTTISAFWILAANSWMQTPAGMIAEGDKFIPKDYWQVIFNPSFLPRYLHMLLAAYVSCSLVLMGVSAYHIRRSIDLSLAKKTLKIGLVMAMISTPLQIGVGDMVGLNVLHHQPVKTAAMEGLWQTTRGAPLVLFAYPNEQTKSNQFEIAVPHLASLINTHHWNGELQGLTSVPDDSRPHVAPVFFGFRLMVGLGLLFVATTAIGLFYWRRGTLFTQRWWLNLMVALTPLGLVASICGWYVAEMGRQPWVVYGLLKTAEAVSPHITLEQVLFSLALLIAAYGFAFSAYLYYVRRIVRMGPTQVLNPVPTHDPLPVPVGVIHD